MLTPFVKMHGCGNDFVVFDERAGPLGLSPRRAAALSDRRLGIGCDQFIAIEPADGADCFMRIRNPGGDESAACGNATRCVAALLADGPARLVVRTAAGDLPAETHADGRVTVDMGCPALGWADVPLAREMDTLHLDLPGDPAALSVGNPHVTFFTDTLAGVDVAGRGAALERDPLFPERVNVGFANVIAADRIRLRVWERGAGLTLACGSGACAALVNAHRRGLAGRSATVELDGGALDILWRDDGHVLMTGPALLSYRGVIDLAAYPA